MLIRLLIASVLGLAIGLERELKRKSLGLKTILVISIVSCLLTIVSIQSTYIFPPSTQIEIRTDPLRLAAQIVSGVGFLGAGVILRREDETISGLTTAAIVWGAAGIGIATGAGFYVEAIVGVSFILLSVELLPAIVRKLSVKKLHLKQVHVRLTVDRSQDIDQVISQIEPLFIKVENIRIKESNNTIVIVLLLMIKNGQTPAHIYQQIGKIDQFKSIEIKV